MAQRTVRVIMNGVTGRMGYRQHLLRSILAIRADGGVCCPPATASRLSRSWWAVTPRSSPLSPLSTMWLTSRRPGPGTQRQFGLDLLRRPGHL